MLVEAASGCIQECYEIYACSECYPTHYAYEFQGLSDNEIFVVVIDTNTSWQVSTNLYFEQYPFGGGGGSRILVDSDLDTANTFQPY